MTTTPSENPNELSLDELSIVPEWAKATPKSYEQHPGDTGERPRRGGDRDRRPRRPEGDRPRPAGPRPDGPRPFGPRPQGQGEQRGPGRPFRPGQPPRGPRPPQGPGGPPADRRPAAPPPVAPVDVAFVPDEKGFAAMVEAMKQSHRAYALFDVAKLVLNKPERHQIKLARKPAPDGARAPLARVLADDSISLSQDDALRQAIRRQSDKLWKEEKKPVDPPKGNFAFVNRCSITGVLLGPPNYHEYQSVLVRHHQRRLRHMPFDEFRSRIQTVKDPEAVKQWVESKSFTIEYQCALCTEPKALASREEAEKHVAETHAAQLVAAAPELQISGLAGRQQPHPGISEAIRLAWLSERRFPLRTAQTISEQLRQANFHFFKHGKAVTYVTFIKLKRFESLDGLSDQVQKIVTFLRAHPDSTRKQLSENLLPSGHTEEDVGRMARDVHWLVQEGYVVEFADGRLWALDNRVAKPVAPEKPAAPEAPAAPETPASATAPEPAAPAPEAAAPEIVTPATPEPPPAAPV